MLGEAALTPPTPNAISPRTATRSRQSRERRRPAPRRSTRSRHFGQALPLPPALRYAGSGERVPGGAHAFQSPCCARRARFWRRHDDRPPRSRAARAVAGALRPRASRSSLRRMGGLGLAVQAYQKRGRPVVRWLSLLGVNAGPDSGAPRQGAYWTRKSSARRCRVWPLSGVHAEGAHPIFSYLACAGAMLEAGPFLYPMFATHQRTRRSRDRRARQGAARRNRIPAAAWHGESLYGRSSIRRRGRLARCRVYAPVGSHQDLLPYLVRRPPGKRRQTTSFVNRIADPSVSIDDVDADPAPRAGLGITRRRRRYRYRSIFSAASGATRRRVARRPGRDCRRSMLRLPTRRDASGLRRRCSPEPRRPARRASCSTPRIGAYASALSSKRMQRRSDRAMRGLVDGQGAWDARGGEERAAILDRARRHRGRTRRLRRIARARAGKARGDAIARCREAADFCRYYACRARRHFFRACPASLPDRAAKHARAPRSRRIRLHLAVEIFRWHLHGPGRRRGSRRHARGGQARRGRRRSPRARDPFVCGRRRSPRTRWRFWPAVGEIVGAALWRTPEWPASRSPDRPRSRGAIARMLAARCRSCR